MKLIADLHTHTIVSGHAYGTIRENAKAAAERKLKILGITEHAPGIPGTCDEFYYCNLAVLPREGKHQKNVENCNDICQNISPKNLQRQLQSI